MTRQKILHSAGRLAQSTEPFVLLYSGMDDLNAAGSMHSYLASDPQDVVISDNFDPFAAKLSATRHKLENAWFGWLGYGLRNSLESLPQDGDAFITLPSLWMCNFANLQEFRHEQDAHINHAIKSNYTPPPITYIRSNLSRDAYKEKVESTLEQIGLGSFYQANITRKFYGKFAQIPDKFALFKRLCQQSPAPYSAYIQCDDVAILSSSPECFLRVLSDGSAETRPIKGSIGRGDTPEQDMTNLHKLQNSSKDRAENLMIVDLMRNDLARSCFPGSVMTMELHKTTTYETIHHMHSTVCGAKYRDTPTIELVKGCFPPGSMTGAPKIRAMQWCSEMEQQERGIYSGTIGWFGGDGSCDLSVVIRTLILQGNKFEFQVGGAIIADSDPLREWEETIAKATGIARTLNIPIKQLEKI